MTAKVGHWIEVDTSSLVRQVSGRPPGHVGLTVSPSPYDVPLALRVVEGDRADPGFLVEVRYLGGIEQMKAVGGRSEFQLQVGKNSGRLYRVLVGSKPAKEGARVHLDSMTKAIDHLRRQTRNMSTKTNYELVRRVVQAKEPEIVSQLREFASSAVIPDTV